MPSVSIAPPTKAQTTTAITLKANCPVILNPFFKFTLLTPLGYNQAAKQNPTQRSQNNEYRKSSILRYLICRVRRKVKDHAHKILDKDIEYKFCRVPETVFKKLISAPSVGTYYHKHVEGKYLCPEFAK